jgi:hypothetical protein
MSASHIREMVASGVLSCKIIEDGIQATLSAESGLCEMPSQSALAKVALRCMRDMGEDCTTEPIVMRGGALCLPPHVMHAVLAYFRVNYAGEKERLA